MVTLLTCTGRCTSCVITWRLTTLTENLCVLYEPWCSCQDRTQLGHNCFLPHPLNPLLINCPARAGPVYWPGYGQDICEAINTFPLRRTDFSSKMFRLGLGHLQWLLGLFPRSKKTKDWSWLLITSSAKVKNECNYIFSPPYAFMACTEKKNFTSVII